ncbi:maltase A1-like [Lutzomyia longipalpis]|uniref:maltase A1-like n=1 Tax=Lutzomyia longipalpis TaxID=7200 RepID=UPI0024836595|nr:maltase A1-like [Lutzomyia longipalpis]
MNNFIVILCLSLISGINCDLDWWKTANVYQIYPRSFKDSDGDGIGDLNGITQMLPYLKDLGIQAFWLSPIFKSPMKDFGYDISNFYDIQPEYGSMEDFERLLATAHSLNLKVLLDFVPNHSSDENEWFVKSGEGDATYKDFYIWHPGKLDPADPKKKLPPSNWLSAFRGKAWKWHSGRGEFYLHQFSYQQPDLNYRNQKVVDTMKDVLRFWLKKGVDGFRVDAVPHLFEVETINGQYPDEAKSGNTDDPDDFGYLYHNLTQNLPETVEMVYQWRDVLDEFTNKDGNTRIMLTEAYTDIDILMQYYGNGIKNGSHVPFNFYMIMNLNNNSNAIDFYNNIKLWLDKMPTKCIANWVMGNHDQRRVGSRFGTHRIDLINMILNTLPGVSITYNGEEIGMTDVFLTWEQTVDPAACNAGPDKYQLFSRDPERTPFQWDNSTSAGFSTNSKTWLPVSPLFQQVNVKVQKNAPRSHLKVYRQLLRLRHTETLQKGSVEIRTHGQNVLSITRRLSGRDTYITIANIGGQRESIDLREIFSDRLIFHIVSVDSKRREGEAVDGYILQLNSYEGVVLKALADESFYKYTIIGEP